MGRISEVLRYRNGLVVGLDMGRLDCDTVLGMGTGDRDSDDSNTRVGVVSLSNLLVGRVDGGGLHVACGISRVP
jgi:hypothetical protein